MRPHLERAVGVHRERARSGDERITGGRGRFGHRIRFAHDEAGDRSQTVGVSRKRFHRLGAICERACHLERCAGKGLVVGGVHLLDERLHQLVGHRDGRLGAVKRPTIGRLAHRRQRAVGLHRHAQRAGPHLVAGGRSCFGNVILVAHDQLARRQRSGAVGAGRKLARGGGAIRERTTLDGRHGEHGSGERRDAVDVRLAQGQRRGAGVFHSAERHLPLNRGAVDGELVARHRRAARLAHVAVGGRCLDETVRAPRKAGHAQRALIGRVACAAGDRVGSRAVFCRAVRIESGYVGSHAGLRRVACAAGGCVGGRVGFRRVACVGSSRIGSRAGFRRVACAAGGHVVGFARLQAGCDVIPRAVGVLLLQREHHAVERRAVIARLRERRAAGKPIVDQAAGGNFALDRRAQYRAVASFCQVERLAMVLVLKDERHLEVLVHLVACVLHLGERVGAFAGKGER